MVIKSEMAGANKSGLMDHITKGSGKTIMHQEREDLSIQMAMSTQESGEKNLQKGSEYTYT